MATRMIDRNGHRWGAGISAVVLIAGYLANIEQVVPALTVVMAIGVFFGLRYSPLGATYRFLKQTLKLDIPTVPEEETPPRFAQLMGLVFLGLGTIGFYVADSTTMGWTFGLIVAALQTLLAGTGICVGCEMYLVGKRLSARGAS
jgi:uncharacterized protein DUF4395